MTTLILLRHGRSSANTSGVLAGRRPGVELDDTGKGQAWALAQRLKPVPLAAVVTSPMERCQQTVAPLLAGRELAPVVDGELAEVDYGDWTGRELKTLIKEPLWRVVQQHPSAAIFPGGEGLAAMQARAVAAIRGYDAKLAVEHDPHAVWLACTHGDVIKAVLADALGLHLDSFQRIMVDPCSISVVVYTETRPFVVRVNDTGGDVTALLPPPKRSRRRRSAQPSSDAVVGGSTGVS
ncbi:MAG TPA: histidine phosphatase family protein [Pseudonocardia sp.]|uniref:histidine phosphatase family protein n=1 Tax=Pseudonocardia sp. TaxID=60912 RepID=UPI002C49D79B|nr:histidine phosphatase family protein [Pseudonocardia sp.]HTF49608.1 histidine phosphatase family protein [Pseudonocardia sp.]